MSITRERTGYGYVFAGRFEARPHTRWATDGSNSEVQAGWDVVDRISGVVQWHERLADIASHVEAILRMEDATREALASSPPTLWKATGGGALMVNYAGEGEPEHAFTSRSGDGGISWCGVGCVSVSDIEGHARRLLEHLGADFDQMRFRRDTPPRMRLPSWYHP